jgi:DNA-binding response OmpR family regulator
MGDGLKLLVVDDNVEMANLLKLYFSKKGYTVLVANTGEEAFKRIEENPDIDAMLLDVMLPDFSGLDILEQVRGILKNAAIIMVTGVNDLQTVVNAMKLGADDYVVKPFRLGDIESKIESILFKKATTSDRTLTAEEALKLLESAKVDGGNMLFVFEDNEEFSEFVERVKKMNNVRIEDMQIGDKYEIRVKISG